MRDVPQSLLSTWRSGDYIGERRPMARLTVQRPRMKLHYVADNVFSSLLWDSPGDPKELPNVKSVSWSRDVGQDTAEATFELWNVRPLPPGNQPTTADFDEVGYFSPGRGAHPHTARWGQATNEWLNLLVPDNIIRSYEGYGFDAEVCPSLDPNLVITGVWRIDTVEIGHDATITITCRDLASILFEQIAYPPVVPEQAGPTSESFPKGKYAYPVQFQSENPEPLVENVPLDPQEVPLVADDSSNTPYLDNFNDPMWGHRVTGAFDGDNDTIWMSVGNARPDAGYAFEWIQGRCQATTISEVQFATIGNGYTAWISIYADGEWVGENEIPYDPHTPPAAPNGADIPYVVTEYIETGTRTEVVTLPEPIENVTKIRVTLSNLWDSDFGDFVWRGGFRFVRAFGGQLTREVRTEYDLKNYDDYTDIVKLFLAWGGFFWPGTGAIETACDSTVVEHTFNVADDILPLRGSGGRVWGDFQLTGTGGPLTLDVDVWDKKPLIDCIRYVADVVGYLFYVDETGGAVFRSPNIYEPGNLLRTVARQAGTRVPSPIQIDEELVLESLAVTLDGTNLRERVFVGNTDGSVGHSASGWNPNPIGLRRVGGWTDQNFLTQAECVVMAETITLRQLFTYRTNTLTIPGNPQIQIDDQVQVLERVTAEGFVHYVSGITSNNDLESGEWTYDLSTHWLGQRGYSWVFETEQLSAQGQRMAAYRNRLRERPI